MSDYSSCLKTCEDTKIEAVAIAEESIREELAAVEESFREELAAVEDSIRVELGVAETEEEACVAYCRPPGFLESLSMGWILVGVAVFVALFFVVLYFAGQFCLTPLFPALVGKDCNKPESAYIIPKRNTSRGYIV
jgi:hypothetical protein